MLSAQRISDQEKVLARSSIRTEGPFACPACEREVVLRQGHLRIHHFAHKPQTSCQCWAGETDDHRLVKLSLFDALRAEPNVQDVEVEKRVGGGVADVFAVISGTPVAIEVQRSKLTTSQIAARTANYHEAGIAVLWVGIPNGDLGMSSYSPAAWERWNHAANFGRVYYWHGGQTLRPVHFAPFAIEVAPSHWVRHGRPHTGGGYLTRSKRWRVPQSGRVVLLSRDFRSRWRTAWQGGAFYVPECTLYLDTQPTWWER